MKKSESAVTITIRVLMVGKEIGSIIGKGGNTISSFREKSGAKISIPTTQGTPERIVTVTGHQQQVIEAFKLITEKLNQDINASVSTSATATVPVSLKLIVPASQCGSIIGRGGTKIKEIRDTSACSIQVQSDMLPFSTERNVMLSGSPTAIVTCIDMLCDVMIQFPAKSATVPYKPQTTNPPVVFHHGQAYSIRGKHAVPNLEVTSFRNLATMHSCTGASTSGLLGNFGCRSNRDGLGNNFTDMQECVNPLPTKIIDADTQEITVSNDLVGSIIGKHGIRIKEIRAISGAHIAIDTSAEKDISRDRTITVTGTPEEISLAQYLINTSIQLFSHPSKPVKQTPDDEEPASSEPRPLMSLTTSPSTRPIPIAQLMEDFGRPGLAGPYPGAVGNAQYASFSAAMQSARYAFMNRSRNSIHQRSGRPRRPRRASLKNETVSSDGDEDQSPTPGDSSPNGKDKRKTRREKFQPY